MSSRARRFEGSVQPFVWAGTPAAPNAPAQAPRGVSARDGQPVEASDPAAIEARLAALERDAFSKGFAQG